MNRFLLDTHLLLWLAFDSSRLSTKAANLLSNPENKLYYSPVSIWEVAVKFLQNRPDFPIDPRVLHLTLAENGLAELPLTSDQAVNTLHLPPLHKDPFDRILIAQAIAEQLQLLTADTLIAQYPGPILHV